MRAWLKKQFERLERHNLLNFVPDKLYLKIVFYLIMGQRLNLINPVTFNEKLQWLKLYDRNPLYTQLVDKYEVRKYIAGIIGEQYLIPLIGVWNKFEDIDFSKLPNEFVLKCSHDSGGIVICKDKSKFDVEKARKKINEALKRNFYYHGREWPYKNVKPRIICEALIKTKNGKSPNDYKFHCFNGEPDNVMVCIDRHTGITKFTFFDRKWNLLRYCVPNISTPENLKPQKPEKIDEMFEIAMKLSKGFLFIRVDLYYEDDKIYFGELTFYPESGFDCDIFKTTDMLFGNKLKIEGIKGGIKDC